MVKRLGVLYNILSSIYVLGSSIMGIMEKYWLKSMEKNIVTQWKKSRDVHLSHEY